MNGRTSETYPGACDLGSCERHEDALTAVVAHYQKYIRVLALRQMRYGVSQKLPVHDYREALYLKDMLVMKYFSHVAVCSSSEAVNSPRGFSCSRRRAYSR